MSMLLMKVVGVKVTLRFSILGIPFQSARPLLPSTVALP